MLEMSRHCSELELCSTRCIGQCWHSKDSSQYGAQRTEGMRKSSKDAWGLKARDSRMQPEPKADANSQILAALRFDLVQTEGPLAAAHVLVNS